MAVIGASGALGSGLALRLGLAGVPVLIGSRDAGRAAETALRLRERAPEARFEALENGAAAAAGEVVFLSVPFRSQSETLTNIKAHLRAGQILVDTTAPLAAAVSGRATRTLGVWQGSAAQQAQEMAPDGVRVVSALHTVSAVSLSRMEEGDGQDVLLCGDRQQDKARVAALLGLVPGLRCVDCGKLEMARVTEQLTALLIGINARYKCHAGIRITGLPEALWTGS